MDVNNKYQAFNLDNTRILENLHETIANIFLDAFGLEAAVITYGFEILIDRPNKNFWQELRLF